MGMIVEVRTSARKKCLNLTSPKGEMTISPSDLASSHLAYRNRKRKGWMHKRMNTTIAIKENVASAGKMANSVFSLAI
jgi:hypothetical protein